MKKDQKPTLKFSQTGSYNDLMIRVFLFVLLFLTQFVESANIALSKSLSLCDEPISIEIQGAEPGARVTLKVETFDEKNQKWVSQAVFQADQSGNIHVDHQAPIEGDYRYVDGMGLFTSLHPESGKKKPFKMPEEGMRVSFVLESENEPIASVKCMRLRKTPGVKRIEVRENGIVGALFLPPTHGPLPCIVTLSGSGGGLSETRSRLLASRGFAVFALGYFAIDGLPKYLENIPLEYFEKALNWIKTQPRIRSKRVGIYGVSRGAELTLLISATFPKSVQAIVATVPSSVINEAFGRDSSVPAWTYQGKPIAPAAPLPHPTGEITDGRDPAHPLATSPFFIQGMEQKEAFSAAAIPVEKIQAPLLLVSGGDDQIWPSYLFAEQIQMRLKEKQSPIFYDHLFYPEAGHQINIPYQPYWGCIYYHPISKVWCSMGGNPISDELASRDSWAKIIAFFQQNLK